MLNKVLLTPVDDLVEFIKSNNNSSISNLKQKLNVPVELIERWLVILEEYNIVKVNYKGFEGYVTISEDQKKEDNKGKIDVEKLKDIFIEKSKSKQLSYDKMKQLWPVFVLEYEDEIKDLFEDKAKASGYEPAKIEIAWKRYSEELNKL